MKKIELYNRYGHKYWLEPLDDNTYVLKHEGYDWPMYITYDVDDETEEKTIKFIDWDGAEPICVGSTIDGKTVDKIFDTGGIIIKTK